MDLTRRLRIVALAPSNLSLVKHWKIHLPRRSARIPHKDKSVNVIFLIRHPTSQLATSGTQMTECAISVSALDFAPAVAVELSLKYYACLGIYVHRTPPKFVSLQSEK